MVQKNRLSIVNVSFGYLIPAADPDKQPPDFLLPTIVSFGRTALLVAAAGNAGDEKTYICEIRPACYDLPNVISVAALDRKTDGPTFLASGDQAHSNYGARIHIAAIGDEVFSTLSNGKFGPLTGTSQAAPQVAAVASLLVSKYQNLAPIQIKNRLIACSDLLGSLQDKLFGGRLNVECTLDADSGRLHVQGNTTLQHGRFQGGELRFEDLDGGHLSIPITNVRSLHFNTLTKRYTVFYSAKNCPDALMLRTSNLLLRAPEDTLAFQPDGANTETIKVGAIVRYTAPIQ